MSYIPKLHHAIVTTIFIVIFIGLAGMTRGSWSKAFLAGAVIMAIMTAVVLALLWLEGNNERIRTITDFMEKLAHLDDEARAMVAFQFPAMQYRMKRGEVRAYFEDTNVPIETFRLFLQTSNAKYISPRRDWYTADKPEWAWIEIKEWLEENGRIVADSAAGSHSWLWRGNAYQHMTAYWMAGRKIADMGEERVFAYDIPTSPLEEDAGGG